MNKNTVFFANFMPKEEKTGGFGAKNVAEAFTEVTGTVFGSVGDRG